MNFKKLFSKDYGLNNINLIQCNNKNARRKGLQIIISDYILKFTIIIMLGQSTRENFLYTSYDYDDNSSLDSGIERSFEINETARKLNFDNTSPSSGVTRTYQRKRSYRSSKVSLQEFEELEREFQPAQEALATSTPQKPKRRYAQGKFRISRSQSPTQIVKIKKYRRIKANDRERNRMHSLNEALGKFYFE